jgi:hypothetical protein
MVPLKGALGSFQVFVEALFFGIALGGLRQVFDP